jgi:CheY-like chemotaxis protein
MASLDDGDSYDDRAQIDSGDKVLLVVQQDPEFAMQVTDIAHGRGFKVVTAAQGKTALSLVRRFKPDAITLDVSSLDKEGWMFLDRLKHDSTTRHIPVHIICNEERAQQARRLGAIGYSSKPASKEGLTDMINRFSSFVSREARQLLIVEDNKDELRSLEDLIEGDDVCITSVSTGKQALDALKQRKFDCMVLDLGLPDMTGFELLDVIHNQADVDLSDLPVIVHTGRSLTAQEETELRRYTEAIVVKGASDYLSKPVDIDQLLSLMRVWLY